MLRARRRQPASLLAGWRRAKKPAVVGAERPFRLRDDGRMSAAMCPVAFDSPLLFGLDASGLPDSEVAPELQTSLP